MRWHALVAAVVLAAICHRGSTYEDEEPAPVTCGSALKLAHSGSGCKLHSHEIPYGFGRGSGQQSVTCLPGPHSAGGYWVVHGSLDKPCEQGQPMKTGEALRLRHEFTGRWLHSHGFTAPITGFQEVSCFGGETESDGGDLWLVEHTKDKSGFWQRGLPFRLRHVDSQQVMASDPAYRYNRPIQGQTEVHATKAKNSNSVWTTAEGVFFEPTAQAA